MLEPPFDAYIVELEACAPTATAVAPLLELPFRADAWLPREIATLKARFEADEPISAIAAALGRGVAGVRDKIVTLGFRRNSTRPWGELEEQLLLGRYGTVPAADIALLIGRSCSSVYARAQILGLTEGNPPAYSEWEDAQVRAGYVRGVQVPRIAELIGRTPTSVTSRAYALGLQHANSPPDWSPRETARTLELAYEGHRYLAIIDILMTEGFPARTKSGLGPKIRKLGYSRGWGRRWTPEEDELIRQAYATGASLTPLLDRLGRTKCSIRWRVKELGLQGTHEKKAGWRTERSWTLEEEQIVRDNYGKMKTLALADLLGRSRMATLNRAWHLGLKHGWMRAFTADEDKAIEIAWRRGLSMVDLSDAMNRDPAVVGKHAARLGFSFSDPERPVRGPKGPRKNRPKLGIREILALEEAERPVPAPAQAPRLARRPRVERVLDRRIRPRLRKLRARRA